MQALRYHAKKLPYIFLIMLFVSIAVLFGGNIADAHSALEKTQPDNSQVLEESPTSIEVWFQDPVVIHSESIQVTNEQGEQVDTDTPFLDPSDNTHVVAKLNQPLSPGKYTVKISVMALDGYNEKGSFQFTMAELAQKNQPPKKLVLEKTNLPDGETVQESPKQLDLWFNQPTKPLMIGVFDDRQQVVQTGEPEVDPDDPSHIIVPFNEPLDSGTYQISWSASPDKGDDEVEGVYYFAVEQFTPITPPSAKAANSTFFVPIDLKSLAYWLAFTGLLMLFGGTLFNKWIAKGTGNVTRWNNISLILFILAIIGFTLLINEQRNELSGLSFGGFLSVKFIWITLVQVGLLTLGMVIRKGRVIFFGIAVLLWPFISGHASYPRYGGNVTVAFSVLHLFAVSLWMGGLLAMIVMIPKQERFNWLKFVTPRFSKAALWSFAIIALSGIWMTIQFLPSFTMATLWGSYWGKALIYKMVLFILLVFIAFSQRRRLKRISQKIIAPFTRNVKIELIYGGLVLLLAGILIVANPSAAEQGVYLETDRNVEQAPNVSISPFQVGINEIIFDFGQGSDIEEVNVKMSMSMPNLVWKIENKAFRTGNGMFRLTGNMLHGAGTMNMVVEATKSNGETIAYPYRIMIPGDIRVNE